MDNILLMGLAAGLGTCLGTMSVIALGSMRPGILSLILGLAAGIGAAVIFFDLLPSSLLYGTSAGALAGFAGGVAMMLFLDAYMGRLFPATAYGRNYLKMGYLIAAGISLHDLPEGLAIAAGFSADDMLGPLLVLAIGLHNIPEGMAVAAPLRQGGLKASRVLLLSVLISLVTPAGTYCGMALVEYSRALIGPQLAFAAGAMTYIVLGELVPESRRNNKPLAYLGIIMGIALIHALGLFLSGE